MDRISAARKAFSMIDKEIELALGGGEPQKNQALMKLKTVNEEMCDIFIELIQKNYEITREFKGTVRSSEAAHVN